MLAATPTRANKNRAAETYSGAGGVMDDYGFDLTHDAKDRMIGWDRDTANTALDSQDWTLSFEANWDQTATTDGGTTTTQPRTHNAAHELLTFDPDGPGTLPTISMSHDAKGNLTGDNYGALVGTYDFDNMLQQGVVSFLSPVGRAGTHSYTYDALGRRVSKTVNPTFSAAVTTVFVYAGQQVIAEYTPGSGTAAPERKFIYGNYIDEPLVLIDATGSGEEVYYYHRNRQYSVIGLTDDTGVVVERYAYTAYGELTVLAPDGTTVRSVSVVGNPYGYTGRRIDTESGLWYFRARYYDAQLGRFLQRDPLGYPDGMHGYAGYFVIWGNVDPSGMRMSREEIGAAIEDCYEKMREIHNDQDIIDLYDKFYVLDDDGNRVRENNGCPRPRIICTCNCNGMGAYIEWQNRRDVRIYVCSVNLESEHQSKDYLKQLLKHELIHSIDLCERRIRNNSRCDEWACSEVRAYTLSGQCDNGGMLHQPGEDKADCVKREAINSMQFYNNGECARNAVELVEAALENRACSNL